MAEKRYKLKYEKRLVLAGWAWHLYEEKVDFWFIRSWRAVETFDEKEDADRYIERLKQVYFYTVKGE
jgi:hypothetical protein